MAGTTPIAPPPIPADPTNSIAGPYVPSHIQTGIPGAMPTSAQTPIDDRLNGMFNPALTQKDVSGPKTFGDFTNQDTNPLPSGMSLKDAFFSNDPKIKGAAMQYMNANGQADAFTRTGGGDSINTPYDQAKRFDNKLGFNPLTNNESVYAQNQGVFSMLGNSLVNFVGKTASYAAQTVGLVGGAAVALPTWNISNMTDNFVTRAADWLKDKTEENFPIYKSDKYTNGNIWQKLGTLGWWTDDAMDRIALTAAMFVPGLMEAKGLSLAGSISAEGIASGLGAKALQAVAENPGGYGTIMKTFLPKLYDAAANGVVDVGTSPALKSYVQSLTHAEMGAWNVLGQSGLNGKETYDAVMKATGDKDKASTAALKSFWETVPLSMTDMLIELPQMFSTINTAKSMLSRIVDPETGLLMADKLLVKGPSIPKLIGKSLLTGLQHGQNESMQVAVSRYNEESAEGKDTRGTLPGIFGDFMDNINDPNGQNNIALGTIQGILTTLGGRGIDIYKGKDAKETAQRTSLYDMINQAQLERRITNGDFAARDDKGNIRTDDKGQVINDQQKIAAAGVSIAGMQQNLQDKQKAIQDGDYLLAALADHKSLAGLAKAYFPDHNGLEHLINLLTVESKQAEKNPDRINDYDAEGNEITPAVQLRNHIDTIKDLKKVYDAIEERHAGFTNLDINSKNKIQVEQAKQFIDKLKQTQYREGSAQIFLNNQLEKNDAAKASIGISPSEEAVHPDTQLIKAPSNPQEERYNSLTLDNADLKQALIESKERYKLAINKEEQRKAFKQQIGENQKVVETAVEKTEKQVAQNQPPEAATSPLEAPLAAPIQNTPASESTPVVPAAPSTPTADTPESAEPVDSPEPPTHTYEQQGDEFVTKDPEGNELAGYPTEEEAQAATDAANEAPEPEEVPPTTPNPQSEEQTEQDNKDHLQDIQQQAEEDNTEYGKMIVNSFSIATKAVDYDYETGIAPKDELGRPTFNAAQNSIIDFGKIVPGTLIYLRHTTTTSSNVEAPYIITPFRNNPNGDNQKIWQDDEDRDRVDAVIDRLINGAKSVEDAYVRLSATGYHVNAGAESIAFNKFIRARIEGRTKTTFSEFSRNPEAWLVSMQSETTIDSEQAQIAIYTEVGGKEVPLGYLHTVQGARRLLTQNVDMQAELAKLQDLRMMILNGGGKVFTAQVTKTGFGFANKGDNRGSKSINEATKNDQNAVLAVKKGDSFTGEGGNVFTTRFGNGIKEGSTVLMLPNNVNGTNVLIPVYVSKKAVGTDSRIKDIVSKGITSYLASGDVKALNEARDYIYVTTSGSLALGLTNNGLFLSPNGELIYRGQAVVPGAVDDLLNKLLINVNEKKLTDKKYAEALRNSPAIQTTFFARERPDIKEKSYFHQHTIQFSLNQTQTNGKENVQHDTQGKTQGGQTLGTSPNADQTRISGNEEGWNEGQQKGLLKAQQGATPSPADLIRQQNNNGFSKGSFVQFKAGKTDSDADKGNWITKTEPYDVSSTSGKDLGKFVRISRTGESSELEVKLEDLERAQTIETEEEKLQRLNQELMNDLEGDGFIVDDIPDSHDLSEAVVASVAAQPSSLLIDGFNAFIQEDAINSISQLLLSDEFNTKGVSDTLFGNGASNKDNVKAAINKKLEEYNALVVKYQPLIDQRNSNALRIQAIGKNLKLVTDNFEAIHRMAIERLSKIGLVPDEQGYYEAVEKDDDFLRFDDDSEYTRNNYDSIGRLVKQFISFNSEKIEKDGKIGNRLNNLGLPSVVQPAAVYTKIINWLSEHYFAPTFEGFLDMANTLADIPDPTIQSIAARLIKSENAQLKFQFFTNMLKFKTDHIQQLVSISKDGVFVRNIEANRNHLAKVVFDQMAEEFTSTSKVLNATTDGYGNTVYKVNRAQVQPYLNEFMTLTRGKASYGMHRDQDGQPTGIKFVRPDVADRMYAILTDLGFGFSMKGFLKAITAMNASNPKGDAQIGLTSLFTGGNKILRNMAEGEGESAERDLHNPFIANPTEMDVIAKAESNFRTITQTDSFRSNGKSYYPFTRLSFVKSIFQQIGQYAETGQITPLLRTFIQDPFKSASRFLQRASTDATFSPELWFARGTKETGSKGVNQEIKDMNDKDFVTSKIFAFQNSGNKQALYFSDTYSDKTTRFQIKADKENVSVTFDGNGKGKIDDVTLDKFYNYFQGELRRVNKVREHNNSLPVEQRISGLHDFPTKEGIGKYFVIFNYLNEQNLDRGQSRAIYNDDGSVKTDDNAKAAIKSIINDNLVGLIERYQKKLERYGMFSNTEGEYSSKGINDTQYYSKIFKSFDEYWTPQQEAFAMTADYVVNSALNSLEMLTLTGDPAQSPKIKVDRDGRVKLPQSIRATLTEVSKRNASLNAPFDQGIAIQPQYTVGFFQDLKIDSDHLEEYKKLLPDQEEAIEAGYKNGDMTDAQEVTTVKQHLSNVLSMSRISPIEYVQALAHFDPDDFENSKAETASMLQQLGITYTLNGDKIREETSRKDMSGYLQVFKPVQRYSRWDENLGMAIETYIKTSSFPLVPSLVKGKDFEDVLKQMKAAGVDRLNFASGTKQGLINPQSIYDKESNLNPEMFKNNMVTLPAAAWGEQVENPEKEALKVTEGSQQQRMIFVDLPDTANLTYKGQPITGKELREKYVNDHKTIFQSKRDELFEELGVQSSDGVNSFSSLSKLSDILQSEGLDRDYDRNTLLSLELNKSGQFEVPLTFLPNSSEIQSLVAAVISNRILKNKLPGASLIQGSEMVIKTNGKVKVSADVSQAPSGSIVWTKPEYSNISKLKYIRVEKGEVKPAQIVLPFYFKTKGGGSVPLSDFTNKDGYLDTSKIDPDLLEINGFRIPYAGPNSGMWFEVVGYLPETMGSLVIVPAEVAAQMGADYDVDKLFTYVLNHTVDKNGIRVDASTPQKAAENDIIQAHKAIYLNKDRLSKTIEPTSTDELSGAVDRNLPRPSQDVTQIYDPSHQDEVWLANRAGQLGVGISANFNTFHSLAQQSNMFTKGTGVKFLDSEGKVYNETFNAGEENNAINEMEGKTYDYGEGENALTDSGVNRLDRISTFPNPYTKRSIPIASVINNWLQASVDNAKLQLLGAAGINKFNFNVALTVALHGFDSDWIIPFINQPILKEYYATISGLNDKFNKDFSADRKGGAIADLFKKYVDKLGVDKYDYDYYSAVSHAQLVDGVSREFSGMGKDDAAFQLEVLKQFLSLEAVGTTISQISGDTKVEVNGLSKSFAEINQQAKDIDTLEDSLIGNIHRLRTDTVSGVYLNVPSIVNNLFNHPDNPLFAYSTPTYQYMTSMIQQLTGRPMGAEELDAVYKDLKQAIYTHPSLGLHSESNPISQIKENLLLKGALVNGWQEMKAKYPNSILLNQLSSQTKKRDNDPDILTMQNAADDIATQIKQEWLDFFKSGDPALVTFVNQLTTYSLLFGSKEYGPSNMIKFIPFEVLKGIGFGDKLNAINKQLGKENIDQYTNFLRQYIQHYPEQTQFLSNRSLPKNTLYQQFDGKATQIPAQFTLQTPSLQFLQSNPQFKSIATQIDADSFGYRKYIRTYVNEFIGHTLYELQQDGRTYRRIDTLGNQYINEYDLTNSAARTIFPLKQSVQQSDQVDETSPADKDNPNPTADDITAVYSSNAFTRSDVEGKAMSVNDALDTIQLRSGTRDNPVDQLHYQLAAALAGHAGYALSFTEGTTRGTTFHSNSRVDIHPAEIQRIANKLNVPYEQALQQTILHEAIHVTTDKYMHDQSVLPESKQSAEYKQVGKVWNTYRKNLVDGGLSTFVRGIQDSFLQAELFKTLFERFADNKNAGTNYQADLKSVFSDWDNVKGNYSELVSIIYDMQESMKQAHALHGIGTKANFELVKKEGDKYTPIDTERVAQIVDYLDKHFTKDAPASLKDKYYAYVSPQEFNTMSLTSPGFMNHLNSVQGLGETKSLWEKFKDIIKKIVSSFNNHSLLSDAINSVLDIVKASTRKDVEDTPNETTSPPWSEEKSNDTSAKTVVATMPTTDDARSFTFADGITIPTPQFSLNIQQREGLQKMADFVGDVKTNKEKDKLFTLSGFAGTGKSSTAKFLVQYLNKKWRGQITFKLASPTHKANKVLGRFFRGTINEDPVTTKALLGYKAERDPVTNKFNFVLDERKNKIPSNGVLIIDEASFIGQKEYQDILAAAAQKSAIVIFMGDIAQIPSPDGSNKVSPVFGLRNQYQLTKVERQTDGNPLAPIYDFIRNNLMTDSFAKLFPHKTNLNSKGEGIEFISGDYQQTGKLLAAAIPLFKSDQFKADKMAAKIIAYGNPTVEMYNREIRNAILSDPSQDFQIGELLMGYEQKQQMPTVQNGQDYIITDRQYVDNRRVQDHIISGYDLKLAEADDDTTSGKTRYTTAGGWSGTIPTFIINPKDINNQPFIEHYVALLEQLKNVKGADYYRVQEKIAELEERALVPETIYSYNGRAYTNSMLRQSFPLLFKFDEKTNQRPIDKMTSIAKNIDYGYAVTAHKVQGSTYKNVFIDENNLEFDKRIVQNTNGKDFAYERNSLLYVALSRPTTKATILSKNTISEGNTHITSVQETQENRPVSTAMQDQQPGPTLNVSDTSVDKIRKGIKTLMNTGNLVREGTYFLKDGTKVQVTFQGEAAAVQETKTVFIGDPENMSTMTRVPFDEYAKKEGFADWADFKANAKNSVDFTNGDEPRYSYSIKVIGKNHDVSEVMDKLKEDKTLKQTCS